MANKSIRIACAHALALMNLAAFSNDAWSEDTAAWWRTVILQEKNPKCVTIEENLYCPSGAPEMIVTYEPVLDKDLLEEIQQRVSARDSQSED